MKTLIFGGLGHVGSWVAYDLAASGREVVILDSGAADLSLPELAHLGAFRDSITFEQIDILDTHTLFERMRAYEGQIDCIVWGIAVIAGPHFVQRPFRNIQINTVGMLNVLEGARIFGIKKFVNLSSGALYGSQQGPLTEETPSEVTDLYGATKASNEILAAQYGTTYDVDVRTARLYFIYGPGRLPSKMHVLYQALFGALEGLQGIFAPAGLHQAIDWTHVRDSAAGVVALIDAPEDAAGEVFNISSGVTVSQDKIVNISDEVKGMSSGNSLGPGNYFERGAPLDITKARLRLGFAPRFTDIRDGIMDYANWMDESYGPT
jgi:nucleoside-diphosphate-sugar epimerase